MIGLLLLADATVAQTIADLSPTISSIGSIGFAVWYAWYTTTTTLPKLLADHRAEREQMQARYDQAQAMLLQEMREQRVLFAQQSSQFASWMTRKDA